MNSSNFLTVLTEKTVHLRDYEIPSLTPPTINAWETNLFGKGEGAVHSPS